MDLKPITESKVLVVEGQDDENLLKAFAERDLTLSGIKYVQYSETGKLSTVLRTIVNTPGFKDKVDSIGVVRDADLDAEAAFQSVCAALTAAGLNVPTQPLKVARGKPKVIVLICSSDGCQGMLEDICLHSVADWSQMECVNKYFDCLQRGSQPLPRNMSKAKVIAFLASTPDSYPKLGVAALKGYWPFTHKAFNNIRTLLTKL